MKSVLAGWAVGVAIAATILPGTASASTLDRCVSVIARDVARFVERTGKCLSDCEGRVRTGELPAGLACTALTTERQTQICLIRAREAMTGSRSNARRVCTDREIDLFYGGTRTCFGENSTVSRLLACLQARAEASIEFLVRDSYRPKYTQQ